MVPHAALRLSERLGELAGRRRALREEADYPLPRRIADGPELIRPPHLEDLVQLVVQTLALPGHGLTPPKVTNASSPARLAEPDYHVQAPDLESHGAPPARRPRSAPGLGLTPDQIPRLLLPLTHHLEGLQ